MTQKPNILFLMTDQMQGRVLDPDNPCQTPNLDKLAAGGFRFNNAYTPNPVCSPARASLMTGLLPHNHGVLSVTHTMDDDQGCLRTEHPHWAQRLQQAGYQTGYFGKWHVERSDQLEDFGWQVNGIPESKRFRNKEEQLASRGKTDDLLMSFENNRPEGYKSTVLYGVTAIPPEKRFVGITTATALDFLDEAMDGENPWCCFVSTTEPHDPFVCGQEAYDKYDVDSLDLQPNVHDDLEGKPGLYRKVHRVWDHMSDRNRREAMACYYGSITEVDEQYGRILQKIDEAGQSDKTIVVLTSDHGELLGAHGLYMKNISAFEEVYNVPLVMAGPGISESIVSDARVGSHEIGPTLLDLVGCEGIPSTDSRTFAPLLANPRLHADYCSGYSEYNGTRVLLTQRITWEGPWKYVFNGFDIDELYNLEEDPYEMKNLIADPDCDGALRKLSAKMWETIHKTGDRPLSSLGYQTLRVPTYGPNIGKVLDEKD